MLVGQGLGNFEEKAEMVDQNASADQLEIFVDMQSQ